MGEIDIPVFEKLPGCSSIATRHHFVKNISCSKHLEEEATAPGDDEFMECQDMIQRADDEIERLKHQILSVPLEDQFCIVDESL
jgi:hypothetical protein